MIDIINVKIPKVQYNPRLSEPRGVTLAYTL